MNNIIWKKFVIGDLFKRSGEFSIKKGQKDTDISDKKTDEYSIALISSSRENGGKIGYIKQSELFNPNAFLSFGLTFDDQWGFTYFQNENHVITGGHNANLIILNGKLKNVLDSSLVCYNFLANIINKITIKTGIFGYIFKINNKFENEVILLPCIECSKEEAIWEDKYTLAVDYIESLMERAKERREANTIKKYEAERKKYEAERKKYEADYLIEKNKVVWKCNRINELFVVEGGLGIDVPKKYLDLSDEKNTDHPIALIALSSQNNGIAGYIENMSEIQNKKLNNCLTYVDVFGLCFYHDYDFVLAKCNVNKLAGLNNNLNTIISNKPLVGYFLAKSITKLYRNGIYNYNWLPSNTRAGREYIELPWIECNKEKSIIEEEGKYYTLPINYISYIYLSGRIKNCQRLIDNYTYRY